MNISLDEWVSEMIADPGMEEPTKDINEFARLWRSKHTEDPKTFFLEHPITEMDHVYTDAYFEWLDKKDILKEQVLESAKAALEEHEMMKE